MKPNLRMLVLQIVGMFVVFAVVMFATAGTLKWPAGWVFLAMFFGFVVVLSGWLLKHNPGLLTERMTGIGKRDQKTWDKVFFACANLVFLAWLISIPLDVVRYRWSHVPVWLNVMGAGLLLVAFYLLFVTFRENSYLSPAVRIQSDRGQIVVSTGPYHYVRHPMYSGALLLFVGATLLLGSWIGLLTAAMLCVAVVIRATAEERTLRTELSGYDAYMAQVRYRFIPGVW
jgi:protein-S-isoprenylcysteine O-methyltransferase Ste14